MIDRIYIKQIEQENPDLAKAIESSIMTIGGSGVIDLQLSESFKSIAEGAVTEDESKLAARILQYRQENHGLIAMKALADELRSESNA